MFNVKRSKQQIFWGNLGWSVKTFKYFAMSYQVINLWKFLVSKSNFWVTKMFWTQHDCAQIHPIQTIISVLSIWQCSKPGTPFHYTSMTEQDSQYMGDDHLELA